MKPCPVCHYISGKLAHSYWCTPALRALVRAAEKMADWSDWWLKEKNVGRAKEEENVVRAVRRFRKERAK